MKNERIIYMKGISKSFPGVQALDKVDLELYKGEVLAIVGENGAGKSTLMKILSGIYDKDEGQIFVNGDEVKMTSPLIAQNLGISTIYQEFNLIPSRNVAENIYLGRLPKNGVGLVDYKMLHLKTKEIIDLFGLHLQTREMVANLSVAEQQVVEILKALAWDSSIIVMDEPTSALSFNETKKLFELINSLCERGVSIIYVSHRLEEVFEIADRIVVLRDGKKVGEMEVKEANIDRIIQMMVGREINQIFPHRSKNIGPVVMEVRNLTTRGEFYDISFELHCGEILGMAGLVGAGRTEMANAVFGVNIPESGDIFVSGQKVNINNPRDALRLGMGMVPEDRHKAGLILSMVIRENISLATLDEITKFGLINRNMEIERATKAFGQLDIRAPSIETLVMGISGGNQQKVILARWLQLNPKILILDEPTRGIDVGAKSEIFNIVRDLADRGVAVLMINSELHEVLGLSDRILVMSNGKLTGEFSGEEATPEKVMSCATMLVRAI